MNTEELEEHVTRVEDHLMKTMGENVFIIDAWITLDNKFKAGEITAEELEREFSTFLLPAAYLSLGVLAEGEEMLKPYMQEAKELFDTTRSALRAV